MAGDEPEGESAKIQVFKDALYDEAQQHGSDSRLFSQQDLLDLGVIPNDDISLLLAVIQGLTRDKLFVGVQANQGMAWRWRSREDAKKYTLLPSDDIMLVYGVIDEAGSDGIWNRTIKNRLKMHESVVKNAIKFLESKGYIASMKNVEHPNKKMYIRANLRPSDRATGGPWFTEGEMDTAFIDELKSIIFEYIKTKSAYLGSQGGHRRDAASTLKAPKKGTVRGPRPDGDTASRSTKRAATEISNNDGTPGKESAPAPVSSKGERVYLPLPAGYRKYPTVTEVAQLINQTGITNNTTLGEADIQQLVDVLCYDGVIEPIKVNKRQGYRVTRPTKQDTVSFEKRQQERQAGIGLDRPRIGVEASGNGLTEVPCGRCPVFDLCEEGGPVSPSNCVYFKQWLGIEDADTKLSGAIKE